MWFMANCLDLCPPQLCTNKNKNKNSQFKCFTNTLRHYPSPRQKRSYLCSLSCHWSESILYILNGQKEHTRAFFVWTACMWESIPILERLGVMLHFPHLYIFILPPTLMWMGFSINSPEVPGVDPTACSFSSTSSLVSIFMEVGVGVGVVAIFRYLRSCGSSPPLPLNRFLQKISTPCIPNGGLRQQYKQLKLQVHRCISNLSDMHAI